MNVIFLNEIKPMIHDLFEKNAVGARTAILNKENTADVWHDRRILTIGNSLDVTNAMWDLIDDRNTQYTNSFVIK